MKHYIPRRGDVIWINFDPQLGHEQAGRRPALVFSVEYYNRYSGLLLCCPITSRIKEYPFEVLIPAGLKVKGAILSDQMKSFDWGSRDISYICKMPEIVVNDVLAKFQSIIEIETT